MAGVDHHIEVKISVAEGILKRPGPGRHSFTDNLPVAGIDNTVIIDILYPYLSGLLVVFCCGIFLTLLPDTIKNIIIIYLYRLPNEQSTSHNVFLATA